MPAIEIGQSYRMYYPSRFATRPEYTAHNGQMVKVLRHLGEDECDTEYTMFQVQAEDGWIGHLYEQELIAA